MFLRERKRESETGLLRMRERETGQWLTLLRPLTFVLVCRPTKLPSPPKTKFREQVWPIQSSCLGHQQCSVGQPLAQQCASGCPPVTRQRTPDSTTTATSCTHRTSRRLPPARQRPHPSPSVRRGWGWHGAQWNWTTG